MGEKTKNGFTLIELLVVIVIIGMIAAIAIPSYQKVRIKARESEVAKNLGTINLALSQFGVDHNGFYPYRVSAVDNAGNVITTSDLDGLYPLGIFGGVKVLDDTGALRSTYVQNGFVQPMFPDDNYYLYFNQYTDPLVALGYLANYPRNPFFPRDDRPMGSIIWAFSGSDLTVPSRSVVVTPGDFVYTFNMGDPVSPGGPGGTAGSDEREDPDSTMPNAESYSVELPSGATLNFRLDLIDSYQLWAYGNLPMNGPFWAVYENNDYAPPQRRVEPRRDFNGNGYRDAFEAGIILYYSAGGKFYEQATSAGGKIVF